jgi:hypothetical protein
MADLSRPRVAKCARCGKRVRIKPAGTIPIYCGTNCRTMAYAKRKRATKRAGQQTRVVVGDARQRMFVWELLQDAGLVAPDAPLPPPRDAAR